MTLNGLYPVPQSTNHQTNETNNQPSTKCNLSINLDINADMATWFSVVLKIMLSLSNHKWKLADAVEAYFLSLKSRPTTLPKKLLIEQFLNDG